MISKEEKQQLIKDFAQSENDCGSTGVQIAILSARILNISLHLRKFKKDYHSQHGLLKLIGQRKSFLRYLKKEDAIRHDNVVAALKEKGYM